MKKLTALLLAVLAVFSLTIGAFAADPTEKDVTVNTVNGSTLAAVYKTNITWDSLVFTYTFDSAKDTWNPETHEYERTSGISGWDKTTADITVTNHSNRGISVSVAANVPTTYNVTGTLSKPTFTLDTAEGTAVGAAPADTCTLTISGIPNVTETTFTQSTITVTITH